MAKVGTTDVLGTTVEIHADVYGNWSIHTEGNERKLGGGPTLEAATAQARRNLNLERVDVSVRFYTLDGKKGVATKIHGKNGNILTRIGGKAEQIEPHSQVFKPDTPNSVRARYTEISKETRELRVEQREIERKYLFALGRKVREELDAANKPDEAENVA